jgi:2-polyprenyl-6-methoxyphenol hydroxylase-like FAD-dependent oxidoreductase
VTPQRIAIVGGSVAGLSLATALRRSGIQAAVYERASGMLAHRGAGVMLSASLVKALRLRDTRPVTRRYYLGASGQVLWQQSVEKYAAGWGDIYGVLRRHASDVVLYEDCSVRRVEIDPPRLCTVGRGEEIFDLIVGADGTGSVVRSRLDPDFRPGYLGYTALRGLVPRKHLPDGMPLPIHDLFDDAMAKLLLDGEHATLYALPGHAEPLNWMWYLNVPEDNLARLLTDRHGRRHRWSLPPGALHPEVEKALRARGESRLPRWMASLVAATDTLFLQPIFHGLAEPSVGSGLALVGDAAHLAVPHAGAGVTLAFEDAITLAEVIAGGHDNLVARLSAWAKRRRATVATRLGFAVHLGRSLQHRGKSWESWSPESFEQWWRSLLAEAPDDKSQ